MDRFTLVWHVALRRGLPRIAGHKAGVEPVRMVVETCAQMGIQVLTLYAFSVENWKRPRQEVDTLWRLLRIYIRREVPTLMRNNVRLTIPFGAYWVSAGSDNIFSRPGSISGRSSMRPDYTGTTGRALTRVKDSASSIG